MPAVQPYLFLGVAIVFEVIGTTALKQSDAFTRLVPSVITALTYGASFVFLALTLKTIPVGLAYAMWSGIGIVLIAAVGWTGPRLWASASSSPASSW